MCFFREIKIIEFINSLTGLSSVTIEKFIKDLIATQDLAFRHYLKCEKYSGVTTLNSSHN